MSKRFFSNTLLFLSSLLITLLITEAILRFIAYDPFKSFRDARFAFVRPSASKERIYEATPLSEVFLWNTFVKFNSHGFRGREYPIKKDHRTLRIVALGDSIGFGMYLPINLTFTEQLEGLFDHDGKKAEVLNLGLTGYDTLQEVATLEDIGLPFSPDLVVVAYCINDVMTMSLDLLYVEHLHEYKSPIYRIRLLQFLRSKWDKLRAQRYVHEENRDDVFLEKNRNYIEDIGDDPELKELLQTLRRQLEASDRISFVVPPYLSEARIGKLRYSFNRLKALKDQYGFEVIVMIVPFLMEENTSKDAYHTVYDIVRHEASRSGLRVLNMYSAFKEAGFSKIVFSKDDAIHPNELGHRLMSEKLYEEIKSRLPSRLESTPVPQENIPPTRN